MRNNLDPAHPNVAEKLPGCPRSTAMSSHFPVVKSRKSGLIVINQRRILHNKKQETVPQSCHVIPVFPYTYICGFKLVIAPSGQIIDHLVFWL